MGDTALDPDVAAFREADSDAERAGVLLAAPVGTLLRWRPLFERYSSAVGFDPGVAYLGALSQAMRARRHRGAIGTMELEGAKTRLLELMWTAPRPKAGHWREALGEGEAQTAVTPSPLWGGGGVGVHATGAVAIGLPPPYMADPRAGAATPTPTPPHKGEGIASVGLSDPPLERDP